MSREFWSNDKTERKHQKIMTTGVSRAMTFRAGRVYGWIDLELDIIFTPYSVSGQLDKVLN